MAYAKVADLADIPVGGTRRVEVDGEPVCLVRLGEDVVKAVHDTCSHQEWSLAEGWVEDNTIECALHGSSFDLDTGTPDSLPAVKPIPTFAVEVRDGEVLVDGQTNDAPLPRH